MSGRPNVDGIDLVSVIYQHASIANRKKDWKKEWRSSFAWSASRCKHQLLGAFTTVLLSSCDTISVSGNEVSLSLTTDKQHSISNTKRYNCRLNICRFCTTTVTDNFCWLFMSHLWSCVLVGRVSLVNSASVFTEACNCDRKLYKLQCNKHRRRLIGAQQYASFRVWFIWRNKK